MTVKQFFSKARKRFGVGGRYGCGAELDGEGFIDDRFESAVGVLDPEDCHGSEYASEEGFEEIVFKDNKMQVKDASEIVTEAFEKLVGQLQGINNNLNRQIGQHQELMSRIENIPEILGALPVESENQRKTISAMIDQLKMQDARQQQMVEALCDIPAESIKQTNTLIEMNQKLSASAEADAQLAEGLNQFNKSLGNLNNCTSEQSEAIGQMNKTFAASDRYFKYVMDKQNKRFAWLFVTAMGVCSFAIITVVVVLALAMKG